MAVPAGEASARVAAVVEAVAVPAGAPVGLRLGNRAARARCKGSLPRAVYGLFAALRRQRAARDGTLAGTAITGREQGDVEGKWPSPEAFAWE